MIFDEEPATWAELQTMVCQAFLEMGCKAEVSKTVDLVRGRKEIDVYVREISDNITTLIFVECKYWETRVPQEIVHGYRTVVTDGGAHKGYIIAKEGFQKGSYDVSEMTNVEILTWAEFNEMYLPRWKKAIQRELEEKSKRIIEFRHFPYGPMVDEEIHKLTQAQHHEWMEIVAEGTEYAIVGRRDVVHELGTHEVKLIRMGFDPHSEPIDETAFWIVKTPREFYDAICPKLDALIARIEKWHADYRAAGSVQPT